MACCGGERAGVQKKELPKAWSVLYKKPEEPRYERLAVFSQDMTSRKNFVARVHEHANCGNGSMNTTLSPESFSTSILLSRKKDHDSAYVDEGSWSSELEFCKVHELLFLENVGNIESDEENENNDYGFLCVLAGSVNAKKVSDTTVMTVRIVRVWSTNTTLFSEYFFTLFLPFLHIRERLSKTSWWRRELESKIDYTKH
jgi:hypothetical protein